MTAKTIGDKTRKPKQTVQQRATLAEIENQKRASAFYAAGKKYGYEQGYAVGHTDALRVVRAKVLEDAMREPEATIRPSWLARMWKWVRG